MILSDSIKAACLKEGYGITDRRSGSRLPVERIKLAEVMELAIPAGRLAMLPPVEGRDELLDHFALEFVEALNQPGKHRREEALEALVNGFKGAIKAIETAHFSLAVKAGKKRKSHPQYPRRLMMINHAVHIFRKTRIRPNKKEIELFLQKVGYTNVKKDSWSDDFIAAGLSALPTE